MTSGMVMRLKMKMPKLERVMTGGVESGPRTGEGAAAEGIRG